MGLKKMLIIILASIAMIGIFVNATFNVYDDLNVRGRINTTDAITGGQLTAASCDLKAYTNGTLYCGTDSTGTAIGNCSVKGSCGAIFYNASNISYEWYGNTTIFETIGNCSSSYSCGLVFYNSSNSSYEWFSNTTIFESFNASYNTLMGKNTTDEIFTVCNNATFHPLKNLDLDWSGDLNWGNLSNWNIDVLWTGTLDWGNLTGFNLDKTWAGTLDWGNLTGFNLDKSWTGTLDGGNITADSLSGTQIAELSDADISNTLTCSDLVAGSEVVADSEVDDAITIDGAVFINSTKGIDVDDDVKVYFGTNQDFCIYFNTTYSALVSTNDCAKGG